MIAAKVAQWNGTHQSLGSFPRVLLSSGSYTTVGTRSLQGVSGALLTTNGSFPTCAHLGYRLMFTIKINIAIFKKM